MSSPNPGPADLGAQDPGAPWGPAVEEQGLETYSGEGEQLSSDEESSADSPGQGQLEAYFHQPTGFSHHLSPLQSSPVLCLNHLL
jgi:hypothetical protein